MVVQITIKSVYGEDKAYPMNDVASHFAAIAGTKTLTRNTLRNILAMGCSIQELDRHGRISDTFVRNEPSYFPTVR